jgi:hypothetical protein
MTSAGERHRYDNSHVVGQGVSASGHTNLQMRDVNIHSMVPIRFQMRPSRGMLTYEVRPRKYSREVIHAP